MWNRAFVEYPKFLKKVYPIFDISVNQIICICEIRNTIANNICKIMLPYPYLKN